jgi:hypothetical protein
MKKWHIAFLLVTIPLIHAYTADPLVDLARETLDSIGENYGRNIIAAFSGFTYENTGLGGQFFRYLEDTFTTAIP